MSAPMLELCHLHRVFGRTHAVQDVSFAVERGQVFGYIGPNGAGKTTSMRILATLDVPTAGDAFVDGLSVVNDPDRVRRRLGFMPDYFSDYPNCIVREYLDFFARSYGLAGDSRRRTVEHVMDFTGLDVLAEKSTDTLSKGMKQRLCLGRAMIHDPAVLVLDEPAAGLDPRARIELREMIRRLAADGKTILISSHILTELAEMCDRVGIIERGQLLAVGTVSEIQQRHGQDTLATVEVRVIERAAELAKWLAERSDVSEIAVDTSELSFAHAGDAATQADLLAEIVGAGFRVVAYGTRQKSLEDVFMHVTKGKVQ
jgi:ABC-2 type transport system ATP-binding protein